jgi:hypothetical protein
MNLSLAVSGDFQPGPLAENNPATNTLILAMGIACYDIGYKCITDIVHSRGAAKARSRERELQTQLDEAEELRQLALEQQESRITSQYAADITRKDVEWQKRLDRTLQGSTAEKESLHSTVSTLREQLNDQQTDLDQFAQQRTIAITAARTEESARYEAMMHTDRQRVARLETQLADAARIAATERTGFLKSIGDLRDSIHAAEKQRTAHHANSSRKGAAGELLLKELVEAAVVDFDHAKVLDIASEQESGDIHVIFEDMTPPFRILLDCKAYKRNVDPGEREKIRHDVDTWTGVNAGILVSLTTGIVGAPDGTIEFTANGKPLMNLCKFTCGTTQEQQIRTLALAFSILRNYASWGASQRVLANAHKHVEYYKRAIDQFQNQISHAEKHSLSALRVIHGMHNTVTQLRVELMEELSGVVRENTCADVIRMWWDENYVVHKTGSVRLEDAWGVWRSYDSDCPEIVRIMTDTLTKDAFVALICGVLDVDEDVVLRLGSGNTKRIVDVPVVHGWTVRTSGAGAGAGAGASSVQHYQLIVVDTHEDAADRRKTFTNIRSILRSKGAGGCAYVWRVDEVDDTWLHTILMSGTVDCKTLPLATIKKWIGGEVEVSNMDDETWGSAVIEWRDWTPSESVAAAVGPKMVWRQD